MTIPTARSSQTITMDYFYDLLLFSSLYILHIFKTEGLVVCPKIICYVAMYVPILVTISCDY